MPNANYLRGARLERLARHLLELNGYIVMRSTGSKGVVDLVAWDSHQFRLIQVKARGATRTEDIRKLCNMTAPRDASIELWERDETEAGGFSIRRF